MMPLDAWTLIASPDRWLCSLIRAELRGRGAEAIGMRAVAELLRYRALDVALILVDEEALDACGRRLSDRIREHFLTVPIVLLSRSDSRWPAGSWDAIVSRPKTISEMAARLVELAVLAMRQPILVSA